MWARALILGVAILWASPALAQDEASLLGLQVRAKVQGKDKPAIVLVPQISVKRFSAKLTPVDGGRSVSVRSGAIARGSQKVLAFKQGVGTTKWRVDAKVTFGTGKSAAFQLEIETTVYPKIASSISKKDVDLDARTLTVRLNQPAGKVDLRVTGDNGKVIHQETTEFEGEEANTPLEVSWQQPAGVAVLKMELRVWSTFGFWAGTEITPFEVDIPHEDVVFDTGKWDIRPEQAPKIDATLALLAEKLKRYGGLVKLQLYIAGYTDTVGGKVSNRELSEKRARSIGAYFKRKGVPIPIYYEGFGEDVLAVKTPDETAEQKNRRALYVLSASPPAAQPAMPRAAWKRL